MLPISSVPSQFFNLFHSTESTSATAMSKMNYVPSGGAASVAHNPRKVRLAYFVTHPIHYQAPLLRRIACEKDIDLCVFFVSDISVRGYRDKGFGGIQVKWDV